MPVNHIEVLALITYPQEVSFTLIVPSCGFPPAYHMSCSQLLQRRALAPEDISRAACVCRQWRGAVESDEKYWEQQCEDRFALSVPKAFDHKHVGTWR